MEESVRLSSLAEGETCRVVSLEDCGGLRSRLGELGFIAGAKVECLRRSFSGDPAAYKVCGAVIALRNSTADGIIVRKKDCSGSRSNHK